MVELKNMKLWHGLPALELLDDVNSLIVFSNINGELVFTKVEDRREIDKDTKKILNEEHFFDCLNNSSDYISEELTVVLSLTEKCNCRCRYCFLDAEAQGVSMSPQMLTSSIDKAIELAKGRTINLSAFGGEPGTEEGLLQLMVDYSKQKDAKFKYSITTNDIFSDKVLNLLIDNNFKVSFSMDGLPEVQNFQRPLQNSKPSYDVVEKQLLALVRNGVNLKVRCTVTNFSVNKMVDTVKWLANLGVKRIHFEPVTPGGRGCNNDELLQPPTAELFSKNLIKAIEEGEKYNVDIICFPYMNMMFAPITFCDGTAENRLVVSPEGVLSSCVEVQKKEHELFPYLGLGQYNFEKNELEIQFDKRRGAKRGCEAIKTTKRICVSCPLKFFCGGGCPTRNYRGSGNSEVVDEYRCDIIRLVMPYVLQRFYNNSI